MNTALFIQATRAVNNKWDQPSLIMEEVEGEPLLKSMLLRLKTCKKVKDIYVVTSAEACDDPIVALVNELKQSASLNLKSLRIHATSPYAFKEENRLIGDGNFLYKIPVYGFNSVECLLEYAKTLNFERAVVLKADNAILMEADFLDELIKKYGKEEIALAAVMILPVAEISGGYRSIKNKIEKLYKADKQAIEDSIEDLRKKRLYAVEKLQEIRKIKEENLLKKRNQLIPCGQVIAYSRDKNRREEKRGLPELVGNEYNIFPVYNIHQLDRIKEFIADIKKATLDNFFELSHEFSKNTNKEFPGYLEIELTNECNLKCENCPQLKLTRPKLKLAFAKFKEIVNQTAAQVPFLCLSGYGEPTLHPQLIDCVKYAKEKKFLRVALETNGMKLDEKMINSLIEAGLDVLIVNLDALDKYAQKSAKGLWPSEQLIERVLELKKQKKSKTPYLILQIIKTSLNDEEIEHYYHRWEHLADHIVIQPYNSFLDEFQEEQTVDFAPFKETNSLCQKTMHALVILADGNPVFCKQRFDTVEDEAKKTVLDYWRANKLKGLKQDFCEKCEQWYLLDFSYVSSFKNLNLQKIEKAVYEKLIPEAVAEGKSFYERKEYEKALESWEKVLKFDPANEFIHQKLDEMLKQNS